LPVVLFSLISIPFINKNKTEGIWLGRLKHTKDKYENISWTNYPVKNLAVYFGYNKTQCDKLNYEKQINKYNAIIKKLEPCSCI
jgi:hypothetical protein